jgi:hypothetical protein
MKEKQNKTYEVLQERTDPGANVFGFDDIEGWEVKVSYKRVGFDGLVHSSRCRH